MKAFPAVFVAALLTLLAASSFAKTGSSCRAAAHYTIVSLPIHPVRLNQAGEVAGVASRNPTDDAERAPVIWTQGSGAHRLEIPSGFGDAEPTGLNDANDIVGQIHGPLDKTQAFSFVHGKFSLLSEPPSKAKAINNRGQIAGETSSGRVAVWNSGKLVSLGECCGGKVFAINNQGEIAGQLNDPTGHYTAFVWSLKRGIQRIGTADAGSSTALALNDAGHVLIQAFSPNQIFLRKEGRLIPVDLSPEFASQPLALNDCDVIVGEYGASSDYYHAFIWDRKNGFRDLNSLIDKTDGWNLESAVDINNRGEIIGIGDHQNEADAGFLLIPAAETLTTKDSLRSLGQSKAH